MALTAPTKYAWLLHGPYTAPIQLRQWLIQGALAKHMSTRAPLDAFIGKVFETLGQGVSAQSQPAQIHSVGSSSSAPQCDSDFFNQLSSLMQWRCQGLRTEGELHAAKQRLGLC